MKVMSIIMDTGTERVKYGGPKSRSTTKAYIALFICMATKAIRHLIV